MPDNPQLEPLLLLRPLAVFVCLRAALKVHDIRVGVPSDCFGRAASVDFSAPRGTRSEITSLRRTGDVLIIKIVFSSGYPMRLTLMMAFVHASPPHTDATLTVKPRCDDGQQPTRENWILPFSMSPTRNNPSQHLSFCSRSAKEISIKKQDEENIPLGLVTEALSSARAMQPLHFRSGASSLHPMKARARPIARKADFNFFGARTPRWHGTQLLGADFWQRYIVRTIGSGKQYQFKYNILHRHTRIIGMLATGLAAAGTIQWRLCQTLSPLSGRFST